MAGTTQFPGTAIDDYGSETDNVDTAVANHINDLRRATEAIETKIGIDTSGVDTTIDYMVNNFFVESTRTIWFYQASTPTGWTLQEYGDKVLAVGKSGSEYDSTTGGSSTDDWTISGFNSHIHTVDVWANDKTGGILEEAATSWNRFAGAGYYDWTSYSYGDATSKGKRETTAGTVPTQDGSWRPSAYVGIIGQYTGI